LLCGTKLQTLHDHIFQARDLAQVAACSALVLIKCLLRASAYEGVVAPLPLLAQQWFAIRLPARRRSMAAQIHHENANTHVRAPSYSSRACRRVTALLAARVARLLAECLRRRGLWAESNLTILEIFMAQTVAEPLSAPSNRSASGTFRPDRRLAQSARTQPPNAPLACTE
jgi:hypothetical protein